MTFPRTLPRPPASVFRTVITVAQIPLLLDVIIFFPSFLYDVAGVRPVWMVPAVAAYVGARVWTWPRSHAAIDHMCNRIHRRAIMIGCLAVALTLTVIGLRELVTGSSLAALVQFGAAAAGYVLPFALLGYATAVAGVFTADTDDDVTPDMTGSAGVALADETATTETLGDEVSES